jgi:hypothetical protein
MAVAGMRNAEQASFKLLASEKFLQADQNSTKIWDTSAAYFASLVWHKIVAERKLRITASLNA